MSNFVVNSIVKNMKDLKERLDYYKFYDWLIENDHEDLLVIQEIYRYNSLFFELKIILGITYPLLIFFKNNVNNLLYNN